jgi:hypothetical protein
MPHRCPRLALLVLTPALLCLAFAGAQPPADKGGGQGPAISPRRVTLRGQGMPLSQALAELAKQTGITVRDRRSLKNDPKLTLNLEGTTFWQAVDAIAAKVGAGVSPYQGDGSIALVDAGPSRVPASESGVFRVSGRRLKLERDLETGVHSFRAYLEVAWEPWFQPFLLEVRSYGVTFAGSAKASAAAGVRQGLGQVPVDGRTAVEVELPARAPTRPSARFASVKGTLAVIGPTKMLTVRFPGLKKQSQTPADGITVALTKLTELDTDHWQVEVSLTYPPGGPKFESFQSWLVNNRIWLEKGTGAGQRRFVPRPADQRIDLLTANRAVIQYDFVEEAGKTPRLGSPADWALVYQTPGRIVEVTAPFELKDLPLP